MADKNDEDKKAFRFVPKKAYIYFILAAFFLLLPTLATKYEGHTGKLLVASTVIDDDPFRHAVIYVTRHNLWHAYGFILNKPLDKTVRADGKDYPVYLGGPVKKGEWIFFMGHDKAGILNFFPELETPEVSERNLREEKLPHDSQNFQQSRFLNGISGWGPAQLNLELMRGKWDVIEYDKNLIFDTPVDQIWTRARDAVYEKIKAQNEGV